MGASTEELTSNSTKARHLLMGGTTDALEVLDLLDLLDLTEEEDIVAGREAK